MQKALCTAVAISPAHVGDAHSVPLYATQPAAGFPSPGDDVVERPLDLNELMVTNETATFYVRVSGDSMEGKRIFSGDILIVDRSVEPVSGMIVVAAVYGELVVKQLEQTAQTVQLVSAAPGYEPIEIQDGEAIHVWGVVTGTVRRLYD
jgi:DNA polymerase V